MRLRLTFYQPWDDSKVRFVHLAEGEQAERILADVQRVKGSRVVSGEVVYGCRVEVLEDWPEDNIPW